MMKRDDLVEEMLLRENIRKIIKIVKVRQKEEKSKETMAEQLLRKAIRNILVEKAAVPDEIPNRSTGINVLEDLLKKIVPVLEDDYKLLTTDQEQRTSFRSHIVNAVVDTLTPAEANNEAGGDEEPIGLDEEVDVEIGAGADDEKFIDIRTDSEKSAEEEPEDPREDFGIEGADTTGRNMAYATFKKIETSVIDSYELLSNAEDQELFYDYLIANLKLYFDKFESELSTTVEEPSNQAYDTAVADMGGEEPAPEGEEEIDLGI